MRLPGQSAALIRGLSPAIFVSKNNQKIPINRSFRPSMKIAILRKTIAAIVRNVAMRLVIESQIANSWIGVATVLRQQHESGGSADQRAQQKSDEPRQREGRNFAMCPILTNDTMMPAA
jgi:hypothetical protein